jgi:hypothetical protein
MQAALGTAGVADQARHPASTAARRLYCTLGYEEIYNSCMARAARARFRKFSPCMARARGARARGFDSLPSPSDVGTRLAFDEKSWKNPLLNFLLYLGK